MTKRSNLDLLFDETISVERACGKIGDRYMRGNPAASSSIDALMYSLRKGAAVLARPYVQQRLGSVDEQQLHDICAQLQKRKPPWQPNEVEMLVMTWAACHG